MTGPVVIFSPKPGLRLRRTRSFLRPNTGAPPRAPRRESEAIALAARVPAWGGTVRPRLAPAPRLLPPVPATSRAGSWSLLQPGEIRHCAELLKGCQAQRIETDPVHPAAATARPHADAPRPSCFASKAGRTVPRPESTLALPVAKRAALRAEQVPGRGKTSRRSAK